MTMQEANAVEQNLYEHAIRSSIRPPLKERISMIGYNRMIAGGAVATMAVCAAFAMIGGSYLGPISPAIRSNEVTATPQRERPAQAPDVDASGNEAPRQVAAVMGQSL